MLSSLLASGLLNPEELIKSGGLLAVTLIVFAESGLFFGFFLPGDSLLFLSGFLSSDAGGNYLPALPVVLVSLFVAAVVGDQVGYLFGRKVGPALFNRPDSRFFKRDNIDRAHRFFDKHGPKTILLARFVPIVRTFAPIVAGVGRMHYRTFVTYNVVGALLWAVGITTMGYYLGQIDAVKENVEIAILLVVAISLLPVAAEFVKHRRAHKHLPAAEATATVGSLAAPLVHDDQ